MLFYSQTEGSWFDENSHIIVSGCESGNDNMGKDMNNPLSQCIHDRGPLPRGMYSIGTLEYQNAVKSMGCVLSPEIENNMCGRSGFFLHLRNLQHKAPDGTNASSDGCITFGSLAELEIIANRPEKQFTVISQFST